MVNQDTQGQKVLEKENLKINFMIKFYTRMSKSRLELLKADPKVLYAGLTKDLDMSIKSAMMLPGKSKPYVVFYKD